MNKNDMEIERKFLIYMPDPAYLEQAGEWTRIEQTYLQAPKEFTARISDRSRVEIEREIPEEEYLRLLQQADPERRRVDKTRWCIPWEGFTLEVDIFPFWKDRAIAEIELSQDDQEITFPPEIQVLREITGEKAYKNAALAEMLMKKEKGNEVPLS